MKVLVTGASGFIGGALARRLAADHAVSAPGAGELDLLDEGAVTAYLAAHGFDCVLHAATWNANRNSPKPQSALLDHNLRMFTNLARNGARFGRMIHFGSGAVYDRRAMPPLVREADFDARVPADAYGYSKYVIARLVEASPNVVEVRPFAVYGEGEDWRIRFISNACCKAVHGLPITMRQNVRFDYLHVDDLVDMIAFLMTRADLRHRAYNTCSGAPVELLDVARMVQRLAGDRVPITVATPGLGREYSGSAVRLGEERGVVPLRPLEAAIAGLFAWYEARRAEIPRDALLHDA